MKNAFITAVAALGAFAMVSCEKNDMVNGEQVGLVNTIFTCSANPTKTAVLSEDGETATIVWSKEDEIKVFNTDGGFTCRITEGAGTTEAVFVGQCSGSGPWTAICIANNREVGFSDGKLTFTLPQTQAYRKNSFAQGAMPCVAFSSGNNFVFSHVCGALKLSLKGEGTLSCIRITDNGTNKLNGTFSVKPEEDAAAVKSGTDGTNVIQLDCGMGGVELSTSKAVDFWFVVPEGAFCNGFEVVAMSADGNVARLVTKNDHTIKAGEVNSIEELTIKLGPPTIGESYATAVKKNVKWVQLWADGPKWAEYNVGASSVSGAGGYYCWGMTTNKDNKGDYCDQQTDIQGGEFDTAKNLWGNNWCMPTEDDFNNLLDLCDITYYIGDNKYEGRNGAMVTGRGDFKYNSVFFPFNGYYDRTKSKVRDYNDDAYYWSSTISSPGYARCLLRINGSFSSLIVLGRDSSYGISVRAILSEKQ